MTDDVHFGSYPCTASDAYTEETGDENTFTFVIGNTGTGDLNVNSVSADKTWLSWTPETIPPVFPGEEKEVTVSVSDWSAVGKPDGLSVISVYSDDPDEPVVTVAVRAVPKTETYAYGTVTGQITSAVTGYPAEVAGVLVTIGERSAVSDAAGEYTIVNVPVGTHELKTESDFFETASQSVTVTQGQISIAPVVNLSSSKSSECSIWDVNEDGRTGLEEIIHGLRIISGMNP